MSPAQDLAEIRSKLAEQGFPAAFRNEHHVVFALPPGMAWALELVHRASTFRVLGGSRKRASRWTPEYVELLLSPRHSRGITQVYLGATAAGAPKGSPGRAFWRYSSGSARSLLHDLPRAAPGADT